MSFSWLKTIILSIIPLGQLYARIFLLNGSLDSKWAFLPFFMFPPLQFIPLIMMKLGIIKKGKGGKPYDWYMLIPMILKFLLIIIVSALPIPYNFLVDTFLEMFAILIPFLLRVKRNCKEINFNNFMNSITQTSILQIVLIIFVIGIKFVPYIGIAFRMMEAIPVVGVAIPWIFGYMICYIVTNMFNGDELNTFCNTSLNKLFGLISIVITVVIKILAS